MKIGTAIPSMFYEKAFEMGYDYVEFAGTEIAYMDDEAFELLVKLTEKIKLPVKGINSYCNKEMPIVGDGFDRDKAIKYAEHICQRGKRLGIECIGIGAPMARMLPEDYDMNVADSQAVEFLKATALVAKKYGITVLFEAVHNHMCDYCNLTSHCKKVVDICNMDNIKMILDFYHAEVMGEDIVESMKTEGIVQLHINSLAENYGRKYITEKDREKIENISRIVKESGYDKSITIEAEAQYFLEDGAEGLSLMKEYF